MKIKFMGAASSVTGSCHMLVTEKHNILLDCGQFQGNKTMDALNYQDFDFDPSTLDYLLLSHSHIDHSGRIPLLVKRGFKGKIFCTDATADLVDVMLKDSGYIHEKEAEWQNRKNERAGKALLEPLYTFKDAVESLKYLSPILYHQKITIAEGIEIKFHEAGHILGSAIVEIWVTENGETTKVVFSGDLGVKDRPILRNHDYIKFADYVIMETTYGSRIHEANTKSIEHLIEIVVNTTRRGGTVVIPSFAVGRTQELLFQFNRFYEENDKYKKDLDDIMVYVDSPMATTATEVFRRNAQVFNKETRDYILKGDNPLDFKNLKFTRSSEESRFINMNEEPKVIISASGMCEAGRIKHHLKHNLWNKKNSIVFVGYQAEGTLGRSIVSGDKDVTIFGEKIHIEAEIHNLEGFSGHADKEGLLDWLSGFEKAPEQIFLVHGELDSKNTFADLVKEKLGYEAIVIEDVCEYDLSLSKKVKVADADAIRRKMETANVLLDVRDRISKVHDEIETILYNAHLAIGDEMTDERLNELANLVLEIEKDTINLGASVSLEK